MTKQIKHILKGVGSVMDVSPATDYSRFIPQENASERMKDIWVRTGQQIKLAIDQFADEQKQK